MNEAGANAVASGHLTLAEVQRLDADETTEARTRWGWLPVLIVTTSLGLLVAAIADARAWLLDETALSLFWIALLAIFVPNAIRLLGPAATRSERLGIVLLLAAGLYLVKIAHSPLMFMYFDEFLHVRTAEDMIRTGRLFAENPLLPVSPVFPGMEGATSALATLGGFSTYEAGVVLLGAARVIFVVGLFLFFEAVSRSSRLAGLAALIYMANPSFIFFSAQFGYESHALPLAVLTLYIVMRRSRSLDPPAVSWFLIVLVGSAVVVSHHVTTLVLIGTLIAWGLVQFVQRRLPRRTVHDGAAADPTADGGERWPSPLGPAAFIATAAITWFVLVAPITLSYLGPAVEGAAAQVVQLVLGESGARALFVSAGIRPPMWEILMGYASVALVVLALPVGLFQLYRGRPLNSAEVALAVAALGYPATQLARLTERGAEISARTITFLFLAVAFVVAVALATSWASRTARPWSRGLAMVIIVVIFVGNVVVSVPIWMRLPGPYLVGADPRSIEPESIAAAEWSLAHLGPNNRFLSDRSNRLTLGTIGQQHPVTAASDRVNLRPAYFGLNLGVDELGRLEAGRVRYVLIDRRLSSSLPLVGVYTERGEAALGRLATPISRTALGKLDFVPQVSRIYDSGNIQIYDIGPIAGTAPSMP